MRICVAVALVATMVFTPAMVAAAEPAPEPEDSVSTPYGELGKWMLKKDGVLTTSRAPNANPINMILLDPTSTTESAATSKLMRKLKAAGFGISVFHGDGFNALVDGKDYGQVPTLEAFVNGPFYSTLDHGRVFGPVPAPGGGYFWTGSFDHERWDPAIKDHVTEGYEHSLTAVRQGLVSHGAVDLGPTDLQNSLPPSSEHPAGTMDYDGEATTLQY